MKVAATFAFLFLCVECGPAVAAGPSKPNIIFVLADDLGLDGVSCYGADKHQTPHIDSLAALACASRRVTHHPCADRRAAC